MSTPLLDNILNQSQALWAVSRRHSEEGIGSDFRRAAALLRSRKRIVLSGMGASFFACIPLQYSLAQAGLQAVAVETGELLYFLQDWINADTVFLLVSRSGESVEVCKLLPDVRARGAAVIGLVNVEESTLAKAADVALVMGSPADQMVAIQSYLATLATLALLDAAVRQESDQAQADLERTAEVLAKWIPECVAASTAWSADFLDATRPLYLLSRGPGMGTVQEGVLLMHETAKASAVGMSVPQFRHGPVEVVEKGFRAVIIGASAATAPLDLALANDATRMGGAVRWIGPLQAEAEVAPLHSWPEDAPSRFQHVIEVIPLQLLAYRLAELRGVRPGEFRWATLITQSEAGFSVLDSAGVAR